MLMYRALQVIAATLEEPRDWEMAGRKGTIHSAMVCCLGHDGKASNLRIKAKTAEDIAAKVGALTVGKPADLPVVEVVPVFKAGDRRASAYELVCDVKIPLAAKKAA